MFKNWKLVNIFNIITNHLKFSCSTSLWTEILKISQNTWRKYNICFIHTLLSNLKIIPYPIIIMTVPFLESLNPSLCYVDKICWDIHINISIYDEKEISPSCELNHDILNTLSTAFILFYISVTINTTNILNTLKTHT